VPPDGLPPLGTEFGRYRLLRVVGEGARGVVYEADDPAFDRSVAIKVLRPNLMEDERAVEEFKSEAEATAQVQHENVVTILMRGEQDGYLYTIMEFVDGPDLEERLKSGETIPWREAVDIAIQVGRALREAHALNLLHRDVKPGNVLLYKNGRARLTDFGIAKDISSLKGFLVTGRAVGTAAYASPEQCLGKRLMPATDVYSLGATLYHMLAGDFPFPGPGNKEFMHGHVKTPLVPPIERRPDIPRPLSNAVARMMSKSPLARYETMERALADLEQIAVGRKPLATGTPTRSTAAVRIESRRGERSATMRVAARRTSTSLGVWIVVAVLVAAAIAAFVFLAM